MIELDLRDLVPRASFAILSVDMVELLLDNVAAAGRIKWIRLAQQGLRSSRQSYIQGIQEVEASPGERSIALVGWLANAIENGRPAWDLRETVLGGPATRVSEDGHRYVAVPFRHGTPGTTSLAGTPMGMAHGPRGPMGLAGGKMTTEAAQAFGKGLYEVAKRLKTRRKTKPAGRMTAAEVRQAFTAAGGTGDMRLRPHHTTSIYTGMRRERKPYQNPRTGKTTTQSQYFTWRTISDNPASDPASWRHPGIEARHLADEVSAYVSRITPGIVRSAIAAMKEPT